MRQEGTGRTGKGFEQAVKVSSPRETLLTFSKGHTTLLPTMTSKHHHKQPLTQEIHKANLAEPPQTAITLKTTFLPCWFMPQRALSRREEEVAQS